MLKTVVALTALTGVLLTTPQMYAINQNGVGEDTQVTARGQHHVGKAAPETRAYDGQSRFLIKPKANLDPKIEIELSQDIERQIDFYKGTPFELEVPSNTYLNKL